MGLGFIFTTQAAQFNILLVDLFISNFCPPLIIAMELLFLFRVYGFRRWAKNLSEMISVKIHEHFFFTVPVCLVLFYLFWTICVVLTICKTMPKIFSLKGVYVGLAFTSIPLLLTLCVAVLKLFKIEGNSLTTKFRIGLQSNMNECNCHQLLRGCPIRRNS